MLFNSFEFILLFLPITLAGFALLGQLGSRRISALWLIAASLFFYGWWDVRYVPLLVGSMVATYAIGHTLMRRGPEWRGARPLLVVGIVFNLGVLAWFKYAGFLAASVNAIAETKLPVPAIVLPLAISFFIFQKIAFLVDIYRGRIREVGFLEFCLFVAFFPQLIAGPIVYIREVLPQFLSGTFGRLHLNNLVVGLTVFSMGLFKKVVLADWCAVIGDPVFDAAAKGTLLTPVEAWVGTLAYSFQLYFDFSGYSDMAIGLAWMFGVRLPMNFASPYKALSIVDFWHRWHMTLSRLLREYLYIPLGGNRHGAARRYTNLVIVMLLGGLWHGAGWTFVVWGAMHAAYLVLNHGWRNLRAALGWAPRSSAATRALALVVTFVAVSAAWVVFRAENLGTAVAMWKSMVGLNGLYLPNWLFNLLGLSKDALVTSGTVVSHYFANSLFYYQDVLGPWLVAMLLIALRAPNTMEILGRFAPALDPWTGEELAPRLGVRRIAWHPTLGWGVAAGVILGVATLRLSAPHPFLYFQF